MHTLSDRFTNQPARLLILLAAALLLVAGCTPTPAGPSSAVDLEPFMALAKAAGCADTRNRLYLIDDQLVFRDIAGNCSDAAYSQTLFGSTPDQVLCTFHDSIAGPRKDCPDEGYLDLFDTIVANLDAADLGLGPDHTVVPVPF
jgi:hypothetical protein